MLCYVTYITFFPRTVAGRHGLGEKDEEVKGLSDSAPEIISTSKTTSMIAGSFR